MAKYVDIVFTVPPGPESEFVETEDDTGAGVGIGVWIPPTDNDPYWRLRIQRDAIGQINE